VGVILYQRKADAKNYRWFRSVRTSQASSRNQLGRFHYVYRFSRTSQADLPNDGPNWLILCSIDTRADLDDRRTPILYVIRTLKLLKVFAECAQI
jgi:hypothetical protein